MYLKTLKETETTQRHASHNQYSRSHQSSNRIYSANLNLEDNFKSKIFLKHLQRDK